MPSFLIYRVYYRKLVIDQDILAPIAPREVNVPAEKPDNVWRSAIRNWSPMDGGEEKASDPDSMANCNDNAVAKETEANKANDGKQGPKVNLNKTVGGKGVPKMGHKKRLELIMDLKVRLELLEGMEDIFPESRMAKEMKILLRALPPALAASEVKNRQAAVMEAQLRMGLLKKMKTAIPSKKFANQMRKLFVGLPPLPNYGNGSGESKAGTPKMSKHAKGTEAEVNAEEGWESVDEMKGVNVTVESMEIA